MSRDDFVCRKTCGRPWVRIARTLVPVATVLAAMAGAAMPSEASPASSVLNPSVAVTVSSAAGARAAYMVSFKASSTGALSGTAGSTVTMDFPTGTNLGSLNNATLNDVTSGKNNIGFANSSTTTTLVFHLFSGSSSAAGDQLSADIEGAVNPSTASTTDTVSVSTSADTSPVTSARYTIVANHPVVSPNVIVTASAAAGARTAYGVSFAVSSTGGLSGTAGSTVTMVFPTGTDLGSLNNATLNDVTSGKNNIGFANSSTTTTLVFHLFSGSSSAAGDQLSADIEGAVNPSTASTTNTVSVSTSSDTSPVTSATYTIVANHPVVSPKVTVTTSAAVGARAAYGVSFTASSTGALTGTAGGTVTMVFPTGTNMGSVNNATLNDVTSGKNNIGFANSSTTTTLVFHLFSGSSSAAGDQLSADIEGAVNPSTASKTDTVSVSTSSDTSPVTSATYAIVAGHQVSTPMVTPSSRIVGASNVNYTINFTASPTGGLSGTAGSTVTMVFPTGTNLGSVTSASLNDVTTSTNNIAFANSSTTTTLVFHLFGGSSSAAGDHLSAVVQGATNPSTAGGGYSVGVSTTSDPAAVTSCPYYLGSGPAAPCVTKLVPASGPAAGGTTVKLTGINFTGATAVKFGATAAASFVVNSATSITAVAPAGSGSAKVTVTTPSGTSPANRIDTFKYIAPPKVTTSSLPAGTAGTAYSAALKASGGKAPYTWSISTASLPPGLQLAASTGAITGTPTTAGTYAFTVKVADSETPSQSATRNLSITIS
jgi:hypothetical protein